MLFSKSFQEMTGGRCLFTRVGVVFTALFCFCVRSVFVLETTCIDETYLESSGSPVTESLTFQGAAGPALLKNPMTFSWE